MSDDFGTVNIKRGDRAREIEILRQHYRAHRDALVQMGREAPSEQLAAEYQRLVRSIETSLAKLDDLEGATAASDVTQNDILRQKTEPGMKPLSGPPSAGVYDTTPGAARPQ